MARKIQISFKETQKDLTLYYIIMEMEDKSHDIKEILYNVLCKEIDVKVSKNQ